MTNSIIDDSNQSLVANPTSQTYHKSFSMLGLESFPPYKTLCSYQSLSFAKNPISSFKSLPSLPFLQELDISNTDISSFQYIQPQPSIEKVNFANTPLSHYQEIALMSVIAYGSTLKVVNGTPISKSDIRQGMKLHPMLYSYLYNGWIIVGVNPLKILNVNTRHRRVIQSLTNIPPLPMEKPEADIEEYQSGKTKFLTRHSRPTSKFSRQEDLSASTVSIRSNRKKIQPHTDLSASTTAIKTRKKLQSQSSMLETPKSDIKRRPVQRSVTGEKFTPKSTVKDTVVRTPKSTLENSSTVTPKSTTKNSLTTKITNNTKENENTPKQASKRPVIRSNSKNSKLGMRNEKTSNDLKSFDNENDTEIRRQTRNNENINENAEADRFGYKKPLVSPKKILKKNTESKTPTTKNNESKLPKRVQIAKTPEAKNEQHKTPIKSVKFGPKKDEKLTPTQQGELPNIEKEGIIPINSTNSERAEGSIKSKYSDMLKSIKIDRKTITIQPNIIQIENNFNNNLDDLLFSESSFEEESVADQKIRPSFEKIYRENLDHSEALKDISSMKDVFKDLVQIPLYEVSSCAGLDSSGTDYISDSALDQQFNDFGPISDNDMSSDNISLSKLEIGKENDLNIINSTSKRTKRRKPSLNASQKKGIIHPARKAAILTAVD
ncbi:hypothetical protein TRFO_35888 [Tritrichomonas foetus]|uniref:Uncharacterized protein n=1 Tax=Tritrichomonas foetus TaxID=1144522 RepID=A0A1J4JGQ3_9EUKA|nr:hypothetical protein TRFO_35888 [Tritrichomonas foetus]|eukprot:OHS97849.1 hypothetical protein TRFO_35888 [Tritrichomonas foetus]